MSIALVVITDGRPFLAETLASAEEHLAAGRITTRIVVDDAGVRGRVEEVLPSTFRHDAAGWIYLAHPERRGFAAAVNTGWGMADSCGADYVFHLEDDFTFNGAVPLEGMMRVLDRHPFLAQIALRRQPWSPEEIAAGAVGGLGPDDPHEVHDDEWDSWVEHHHCFTTNPSLIPRAVSSKGSPATRWSSPGCCSKRATPSATGAVLTTRPG